MAAIACIRSYWFCLLAVSRHFADMACRDDMERADVENAKIVLESLRTTGRLPQDVCLDPIARAIAHDRGRSHILARDISAAKCRLQLAFPGLCVE